MPSPIQQLYHIFKRSAFLKLGLKVGLTFGALWLVFHEIDFDRLQQLFAKQELSLLVVTLLLITTQSIMGAIRWRVILTLLSGAQKITFPLWRAIRISYIGMFFNICLPGGTVGGDAVRVWIIRASHVPLSLSIHSVIIDRIMALVALVIMAICALPAMGQINGFDGALLMPVFLTLLLAGVLLLRYVEKKLSRYADRHYVSQLLYFTSNLRILLKSPLNALHVMAYAISGHMLYCIGIAYIAMSLSIGLSIYHSLILVPPVVLAATLPVSVGGWGVRELAMILMLAMIGIPQEEALVLSLEAGLMNIVTSLPGGVLWLANRQYDKAGQPEDGQAK